MQRQLTGFPAILVAVHDGALRQKLIADLSQDRCLVLEADTEDKAIHIFITQSRPIHVAVVEATIDLQELEQRLTHLRPNLYVVCVTADLSRLKQGVNLPHVAMSKVREMLGTGGDKEALVGVPDRPQIKEDCQSQKLEGQCRVTR